MTNPTAFLNTTHASLVRVEQGNEWQPANVQLSFMAGTLGAPPIPVRPPQ
jgi:hypothetical protein